LRIFKTKWFARFARRERLSDSRLAEIIQRAGQGLIDANLGGELIKQRVARPGQGRSGGHRVLIAYRAGHRAVFLFGFAKSGRANIDPGELLAAREIATGWLAADAMEIAEAIEEGELQEIEHEEIT
jgi:hypothetical protein